MNLDRSKPRVEDVIKPGDRVAVFVDAANFEHACRELGFRPHYKRLRGFLRGRRRIVAAYYYDLVTPTKRDFHNRLSSMGYTLRLRTGKEIHDKKTGQVVVKCNIDSELIVEMLATASEWDVAWLLSGDSDYAPAAIHLCAQGKRVNVLSSKNYLARELESAATRVFLLEDCKEAFTRQSTGTR